MDDQIGRLIKKLQDEGKLDNTIIIFTSDHGSMLGEHTQFEKGMFYDEATRVPFIIYWKDKLPNGKVITDLTEHIDIAPTLLNLAKINTPKNYVGKSLLQNVNNIEGKEYIFGERGSVKNNKGPKRVWVRTEKYTLNYSMYNSKDIIAVGNEKDGFLADLSKDPNEKVNLYDNPEYSEIKKDLESKIIEWINSTR